MSFGNELKSAREAQALSIQDVAQRIKIRGDYLRALEAEDLQVLPERTFARSYVQSYARALGLDAAALLRDFDRLMPQPAEQVNNLRKPGKLTQSSVARGRNTAGLVGWLLGGAVVLGVVGYLGYSTYTSRSTLAKPTQNGAAQPSSQQVRLTLNSTPSGARVYLDNSYLGLTPVAGFPLAARAQAALRVEYGGRQSYTSNLNLQTSRNLSVNLLPMTAAQLAAQKVAIQAAAAQKAAVSAAAKAAVAKTVASASPAVSQLPGAQAPQVQTPKVQVPVGQTQAAPASGVRLTWAGAAWTRVTTAGGQVLYQGIPAAGTSRDFPSGVTVRTGSAGLVTATVGGGQPQKLGAVGAVVTRTF
jgi:cytoskeleton protein RodZ